jgi:Leucine-rich repeat (LRR) protein
MSFDQVAVLKWWIDNGAKLSTPLTKLRNDNSIRTLVEVNYNLDLKEKSYIEKLRLDPVSENKLKILSKEKYRWRFLNSEKSLLEIKFIAKKITSDDINLLQTLKGNITWLNLSNCELKDEMLSTMSEFPNLTRLRIQKNNLTDRGVPFLKNIKNLRELNIYGTQITDASFNIFSQMKSLEKIFLWNSKVSTLGIEKFKTQNPTIEIISGL